MLCGRLASVAVLGAFLGRPRRAARPRARRRAGARGARRARRARQPRLRGAARSGSGGHGLATVSVLGSLYPLTTVLLARAFLGERLGRIRLTGVTAVLGGVALISLASG